MSRDITIASDGSARDTVIFDDEGTKLERIRHVEISIDAAEDKIDVVLEVNHARVNIKGTVREITFVCPCCSESFTHECDEGTSMTSGSYSPGIVPLSNQPQPVATLPQGLRPASSPGTGAAYTPKWHAGLALLEFHAGQHSVKSISATTTCSHEFVGIPTGGGVLLQVSCDLGQAHTGPHLHEDGPNKFYWTTTLTASHRP
jgi:hypothetical protein